MRETLFRGQPEDTLSFGKWAYGSLIDERLYNGEKGKVFIRNERGDIAVHPKTVGQYTGIKDKNGVKIFEGDIIAGVNGSVNGIGWDFGPKQIKWNNERAEFNVPLWGGQHNHNNTHWIERRGDIYNNHELLENKQ